MGSPSKHISDHGYAETAKYREFEHRIPMAHFLGNIGAGMRKHL